jgi:SAM-dependent methyltransferase
MCEAPKDRKDTWAPPEGEAVYAETSGHIPAACFETKYQKARDPWSFAASAYEQRRYDLTVAMLPAARYRRVFEPGCSVGELTARLAGRCDRLLAMDSSPTAVKRARERCVGLDHVDVVEGELPQAWPDGTYDLVVLSELGYYFTAEHWAALVARSAQALLPDGTLLAVHWRGRSPDHVLRGDDVHAIARSEAGVRRLQLAAYYVEAKFRADVWTKVA